MPLSRWEGQLLPRPNRPCSCQESQPHSEESSLFGQRAMNSVTEQLRVGGTVTLDCTFKNALRVSDLTISQYKGDLSYSIQLDNCIIEENEETNRAHPPQEQSQSTPESTTTAGTATIGQQNADAPQGAASSTVQPARINSTQTNGLLQPFPKARRPSRSLPFSDRQVL